MSKFLELAQILEKAGGEGSKGGKVIGHTKSGKPIYETANHPSHATFSHQDHSDAMNHHYEIWNKTQQKIAEIKEKNPKWNPPKEVVAFLQHHHTQAQMHQEGMNRLQAKAERTQVKKGLNDLPTPLKAMVVIVSPDRSRVLLGQRNKDRTWTSPGGRAEIGEHPEDAAVRETFEECGIPLRKEQLEQLPMMYTAKMVPVHCYMAVTTEDQIQHIESFDDPSQEIKRWKWFGLNEPFPDPIEDNRYNTLIHAKMRLAGMEKSFELLDPTEAMTQMHTDEFAQEAAAAPNLVQMISKIMEGYQHGEEPRPIPLESATLYLEMVSDGVYSGFVKRLNDQGLVESVANVEKMTIPAMVQFLTAKQLLPLPAPDTKPEPKDLSIILEALAPKTDLLPMIYVSIDGDNIGNQVAAAEAKDDESALQAISQKIQAGQTVFQTWAASVGGSIIESGGDEGLAKIPADCESKIEKLRELYAEASGATCTVGVGDTISHSTKARLLGKLKGKDRIEHFGPNTEEELRKLFKPKTVEEKIRDSGVLDLTKALLAFRDSLQNEPTSTL